MRLRHFRLFKKITKENIPNNPDYSEKLVLYLVDMIGMRRLGGPYTKKGTARPGYSSVVIVEESTVTVHTFIEEEEIWFDITSCQYFNKDKVKEYLNSISTK